jgi:hypothetical protein
MEKSQQKPIYALIVGIDKYNPPVPPLGGAVSDATKLKGFLEKKYSDRTLNIKVLLNEEATYENLLNAFRTHLSQAGPEDVAWFHYSGHGSRQPSAPELEALNSGAKDETLVLYDSRPSGKELADKELGLLLNELNAKDPHIIVTLDCCHSGSGTRNADITGSDQYQTRLAVDRQDKRPLDTYLDGYFLKNALEVPESKHILLAACNRFQTAKESWSGSGLFTENLIRTLEDSDGNISYADIFMKLRQGVVGMNWDQDPQIEPMGGFNGYGRFLDGSLLPDIKKYALRKTNSVWQMDAGEIMGFFASEEDDSILILDETGSEAFSKGKILESAAQTSIISPERELDDSKIYWAVPAKLDALAEAVILSNDDENLTEFQQAAASFPEIRIVNQSELPISKFTINRRGHFYELIDNDSGKTIIKTIADNSQANFTILQTLQKLIRWNKLLNLSNKTPLIADSAADIFLEINYPDGKTRTFTSGEILLPGISDNYLYRIMIKNKFTQPLHFSILYLSENFGVFPLKNEPLENSGIHTLFWGGGEDDYFHLPTGSTSSVDIFKIIISTERTDDFLFHMEEIEMQPIGPSRAIPGLNRPTKVKGAWFTSTFKIIIKKDLV